MKSLMLILSLFAITTNVEAASRAESFTAEQMYSMAQEALDVTRGQVDDIEKLMNAMQFRGYIAAILDADAADGPYQECARRKKLSEIIPRAASVITANPLDRSGIAASMVHVAIRFACDDNNWK